MTLVDNWPTTDYFIYCCRKNQPVNIDIGIEQQQHQLNAVIKKKCLVIALEDKYLSMGQVRKCLLNCPNCTTFLSLVISDNFFFFTCSLLTLSVINFVLLTIFLPDFSPSSSLCALLFTVQERTTATTIHIDMSR